MGIWITMALVGMAGSGAMLGRPMPASADGLTIAIGSPLTDCPTLSPCYLPPTATVAAGEPVTWLNKAVIGNHTATADDGHSFDTGEIATGQSVSRVIPPGTYGYHDRDAPGVKGTITVTAPPPGASSGAGSGPLVAGSADGALKPGQSIGQVTGAAAAKPKVVAATTPTPVFGPGTIGKLGNTSLPPIDAAATPDSSTLPPISSPPPSPRPRTLASAPAGRTDGSRSGAFYLVGALLFLLIAAGAGGFYGFRRWRGRGSGGLPPKASTA